MQVELTQDERLRLLVVRWRLAGKQPHAITARVVSFDNQPNNFDRERFLEYYEDLQDRQY